jgi:hypothetical protein
MKHFFFFLFVAAALAISATGLYSQPNTIAFYPPAHPKMYNTHPVISFFPQVVSGDTTVLETATRSNWTTSFWSYISKDIYFYNEFAHLKEVHTQTYFNNEWTDNHRFTYAYDNQSRLIEEMYQIMANEAWENNHTVTDYVYSVTDLPLQYTEKTWVDDHWVNTLRVTLTYDTDEYVATELQDAWTNEQWDPSELITYNTLNGKDLGSVAQFWNTDQWYNDYKFTNVYDEEGKMLEKYYQYWSVDAWLSAIKVTYSYDANGNLIEELMQNWDGSGYVNDNKMEYTYMTVTEVEELANPKNVLIISPNPSSGSVSIDISGLAFNQANWSVTDCFGRQILNGAVPVSLNGGILKLYLNGFADGVYYFNLNQSGVNYFGKIILVK